MGVGFIGNEDSPVDCHDFSYEDCPFNRDYEAAGYYCLINQIVSLKLELRSILARILPLPIFYITSFQVNIFPGAPWWFTLAPKYHTLVFWRPRRPRGDMKRYNILFLFIIYFENIIK